MEGAGGGGGRTQVRSGGIDTHDVLFGRERAPSFSFSHPEWGQELWKHRAFK